MPSDEVLLTRLGLAALTLSVGAHLSEGNTVPCSLQAAEMDACRAHSVVYALLLWCLCVGLI